MCCTVYANNPTKITVLQFSSRQNLEPNNTSTNKNSISPDKNSALYASMGIANATANIAANSTAARHSMPFLRRRREISSIYPDISSTKNMNLYQNNIELKSYIPTSVRLSITAKPAIVNINFKSAPFKKARF